MWGKEVFLKKIISNKIKFSFILYLIIIFSNQCWGKENTYRSKALNYLNTNKEFSSSFLQIQNGNISEGIISLKDNRLRVEYLSPANIIFIINPKKGMYFNKDLNEVEYFNPKKTSGKIFLDFFYDADFLKDTKITTGNNFFYFSKEIIIKKTLNKVDIYFEDSPLKLRKIEITNDGEITSFTIINPNYNPDLTKDMFSMINPLPS